MNAASSDGPNYDLGDVDLIEDKPVYQGFFQIRCLQLRHKLFRGGWSEQISRELFVRHDAVGVLLFDPVLDSVALVEQFRVGAFGHELSTREASAHDANDHETFATQAQQQGKRSPWLLELVAGLIDKDEPPAIVAERETLEEAGALIDELEPIAQYYSSPGGSSEFFHLFCAKVNLAEVGGIHGLDVESEDIRVHVMPVGEAFSRMQAGELNNAHTIIALQWLQLHGATLRKRWLTPAQI